MAVLLRQMYGKFDIFIGDVNDSARRKAVDWIANGDASGVT